MIENNLIRTPKVQLTRTGSQVPVESFDFKNEHDEDEIMLEESWSHLQLVYEILLRIVLNNHFTVQILKDYLDVRFLTNLFELIKSPDPRERDYLKTIFHKIYKKMAN